MSQDSKIQWTTHTFNGWWGCTKVDSDCKNCYADTLSHRWGYDIWGPKKQRRFFKDKHWNEPLKWNAIAADLGIPVKVFCGSMMDWAEKRSDLVDDQKRLFELIENTPYIIWQMLTKRPHEAFNIIPDHWKSNPLPNVWMGTSVGHNDAAYRIDLIKKIPAVIHWLSCEPMTEDLEIHNYIDDIDWIVCGGESGPGARPFKERWADNLLNHSREFGIAFFMKQFGEVYAKENNMRDKKGGDITEFPAHLRIREFPKNSLTIL